MMEPQENKTTLARLWPAWLSGAWGAAAVGGTLYAAVFVAWVGFHWGPPEYRALGSNLAMLPIGLLMSLAAFRAASAPQQTVPVRRAWLLIALGFLATFLGDSLWAYFESGLGVEPFPSLADAGYLLFYPLVFAGLLALPGKPVRSGERWAAWLEVVILGVVAALVVVIGLVLPSWRANETGLLAQVIASAYPIGSLMLVIGLALGLYRRPDPDTRDALVILVAGTVLFVLADFAFTYTSLQQTYQSGNWVDAGYVAAQGLFLLAGVRQAHRAPGPTAEPGWLRLIDRVRQLSVVLALGVSYGLVLFLIVSHAEPWLGFWAIGGAAVVTLLAMVRLWALLRSGQTQAVVQQPAPLPGAETARRIQGARRVMLVIMAAASLLAVYGLVFGLQTGAWQRYVLAGLAAGAALAGLVGFALSRRGRLGLALTVALSAVAVALFGVVLVQSGLGIALSLIFFVLVIASAGLVLTGRPAVVLMLAGGTAGALILILDVVGSAERLPAARPAVTISVAGLAGLVLLLNAATRFHTFTLRTKVMVSFLAVVSLAVIALTLVVSQVVSARLTDETGQRLAALAASKENEISQLLQSEFSALRVLSLNRFVQDSLLAWNQTATGDVAVLQGRETRWRAGGDEAARLIDSAFDNDLATELREFQRALPDHVNVTVTDLHGSLVATTNPTANYYQADEPWWQAAYDHGVFLSQPQYDDVRQAYILGVALPIYGHDSADIVGIVRADLSLDVFYETLAGGQFGQSGRTELYLADGQTIELETGDEAGTLVLEPGELSLDELARFSQLYRTVFEKDVAVLFGQARLGAETAAEGPDGAAIHDLGWYVVTQQSQTEALQTVADTTRVTVLVMLGVLIAAGVAALLVAQILTGPIVRLTAVAAQVAGGDLKALAPIEADDEIGALATTFNVMTTQLRETLDGLEERVRLRTQALAASAEVSRRLAAIADEATLVRAVVDEIQAAFGYYHAHVYVWEADREHLRMVGGTGSAGQALLERGHRLPKGRGLVGRAAEHNTTVLVPDTTQNPDWLPNPLLPDTKAEVAVPIAIGERVLGVLDVQHNVVNGLRAEDAELLQALAHQVAIALQNARAYRDAQAAAEREAQLNLIGQRIQSAATVEAALQIAARELGRATGAPARVRLGSGPAGNGHASRGG